jgi:hypothetical protein
MGEAKIKKTAPSVTAFVNDIEDSGRKADAKAVLGLMKDVSGLKPAMCGTAIVGFGSYKTASGDWPLIGFSPRKTALVLYLAVSGFEEHASLLKQLGKHKTGKGCLYINKMSDIDPNVLRKLVKAAFQSMRAKHA